ncbi:MAG: hypothetical protein K1X89_01865 [Myxococcaceae bacterium]|nr:hypothetical protein [Myxococcaceae bacterium]
MKRRPTRKAIQAALVPAIVDALDRLDFEQDSTTLLRTVRALTEIAYDLARAGACPKSEMLGQLHRVTRRRLRDLPTAPVVWVMPEAKA